MGLLRRLEVITLHLTPTVLVLPIFLLQVSGSCHKTSESFYSGEKAFGKFFLRYLPLQQRAVDSRTNIPAPMGLFPLFFVAQS